MGLAPFKGGKRGRRLFLLLSVFSVISFIILTNIQQQEPLVAMLPKVNEEQVANDSSLDYFYLPSFKERNSPLKEQQGRILLKDTTSWQYQYSEFHRRSMEGGISSRYNPKFLVYECKFACGGHGNRLLGKYLYLILFSERLVNCIF